MLYPLSYPRSNPFAVVTAGRFDTKTPSLTVIRTDQKTRHVSQLAQRLPAASFRISLIGRRQHATFCPLVNRGECES